MTSWSVAMPPLATLHATDARSSSRPRVITITILCWFGIDTSYGTKHGARAAPASPLDVPRGACSDPGMEQWDAGDLGCSQLAFQLHRRMKAMASGDAIEVTTRDPGRRSICPLGVGPRAIRSKPQNIRSTSFARDDSLFRVVPLRNRGPSPVYGVTTPKAVAQQRRRNNNMRDGACRCTCTCNALFYLTPQNASMAGGGGI